MISVQEATNILFKNTITVNSISVPIQQSLNKILAEDIYAYVDIPTYSQSAVDGYAIKKDFFQKNKIWKIKGEIKAGDNIKVQNLKNNECNKIYTGAKVPSALDVIIMKEYAEKISDNEVMFNIDDVTQYQNIRHKGEEIKKGEKIFSKNIVIKPEHIAVLSSIGKSKIKVKRDISILILATGNELKKIGSPIKTGEKYESNGIMLQQLIKKYFDIDAKYLLVKDDKKKLLNTLTKYYQNYDIIITTGGVSVGDYDFTKPVIKELNYNILIDKVAQKPGKPFVFAVSKQNKVIFGLPGNPRAALSCFYIYILRYIYQCYGICKEWPLPVVTASIDNDLIINDNRTRILFVNIHGNKISIPEKQDSHMLISSANADGIIVVNRSIKKNEHINVYLI